MKAALLIRGVNSTYVFKTALENLERWFTDERYVDYGLDRPIWIERSNDENSALIVYNGNINEHKKLPEKEGSFFTSAYNDKKIGVIFQSCLDNNNSPMLKPGDGVYFVTDKSDAATLKNFADKLKGFSVESLVNPGAIASMEGHNENGELNKSVVFALIEKIARDSEIIALENARKQEEEMKEVVEYTGLENFEQTDTSEIDSQVAFLTSIQNNGDVDPASFVEPISEVNPEDLDPEDNVDTVPKLNPDGSYTSEETIINNKMVDNTVDDILNGNVEATNDDIKLSEPVSEEVKPVVEPVVEPKAATPNNSIVEAITGLINKLGITEAEFISRLEKVLLIGKMAGGVTSANVEEPDNKLQETVEQAEVQTVIEDKVPAEADKDRGSNGDIHYIDTPDGVVSNISGEELFGEDFGGDEDESDTELGETNSGNTGEDSSNVEDNEPVQEKPKEINEDAPAEELIKELANESKNDDEFFEMLVARRVKFGMPTLLKAASIDMRNYVLTGVENHVEPSTKSKRINLI